ncbi:PEP-CTERM sorting domain-containing protein [Desulfotalea psychrophila]|uniref:PEP-CTERM sorting domain-containing protein n=1 Tax=Desulfotalea psychrophila TaxID=84980 RepID=A0ABS3ATF4_9BACT|nr:PEP-CTERM sorting domain-containing protein [Desulfocapsa sp.]MBN4068383.1 PEP-CTERM sorting domain-containing protein [Desulfotalea psychrophila]MBN4071726.1 PEP-CTERM sorting domain-containing protein [Desulfotalea psychrophila]
MNITQSYKLAVVLFAISLFSPTQSFATLYAVSGNFWGEDGAEVYGSLSVNDTFSASTIEDAWSAYLSSSPESNFYLELEFQITSFDFYRTGTTESYFHGNTGSIDVIVTGQPYDGTPNATWYSAWTLQGTGLVYNAYSSREEGDDVIFSNNGNNALDFDYDLLPQTIQLNAGYYNDDPYNTSVNLTLTASQPIPEPNTLLLLGLGAILLSIKRKNS